MDTMDYTYSVYSTNDRVRKRVNELRGEISATMVVAHPNVRGTGALCRFVVAEKPPHGRVWIEIAPQDGCDVSEPAFDYHGMTIACAPAAKLLAVLRGEKLGLDCDKLSGRDLGIRTHVIRNASESLTMRAFCCRYAMIAKPFDDCHIKAYMEHDIYHATFDTNENFTAYFDLSSKEAHDVADWLEETLSSCAKCA